MVLLTLLYNCMPTFLVLRYQVSTQNTISDVFFDICPPEVFRFAS